VSRRALLLGLLAFVLALLTVLPARWVGGSLPSSVRCEQWRGTVWRGRCRQLAVAVPGQPALKIESAAWTLHPLPLLHARLAAEVVLTDARGDAAGHVEFSRDGRLVLQDLSARVLFDPQLPSAMPQGWRGRVEIQHLDLDWRPNELRRLQGQFHFLDLRDDQERELGDYRLDFPPATAPPFTGQLADEGGPLELRGTLQLTADQTWTLDGTVAARASADPGIQSMLQVLGPADGSGRYPLSATGHFTGPTLH
jgi:hypothetical protein